MKTQKRMKKLQEEIREKVIHNYLEKHKIKDIFYFPNKYGENVNELKELLEEATNQTLAEVGEVLKQMHCIQDIMYGCSCEFCKADREQLTKLGLVGK